MLGLNKTSFYWQKELHASVNDDSHRQADHKNVDRKLYSRLRLIKDPEYLRNSYLFQIRAISLFGQFQVKQFRTNNK